MYYTVSRVSALEESAPSIESDITNLKSRMDTAENNIEANDVKFSTGKTSSGINSGAHLPDMGAVYYDDTGAHYVSSIGDYSTFSQLPIGSIIFSRANDSDVVGIGVKVATNNVYGIFANATLLLASAEVGTGDCLQKSFYIRAFGFSTDADAMQYSQPLFVSLTKDNMPK